MLRGDRPNPKPLGFFVYSTISRRNNGYFANDRGLDANPRSSHAAADR